MNDYIRIGVVGCLSAVADLSLIAWGHMIVTAARDCVTPDCKGIESHINYQNYNLGMTMDYNVGPKFVLILWQENHVEIQGINGILIIKLQV